MTRDEAERRARRLQAEHPDRESYRFVARPAAGSAWEVARAFVPEALRGGELVPTIDARPRPPHPEDPRTGHERRIPGIPGGL